MSDFLQRLYKISGTNNQSEIARQLDIPNTTLSNWISRGVSKSGALKISQVYSANLDYVLTGQGGIFTENTAPQAPNHSVIDLIDTLKTMESEGELDEHTVGFLNNALSIVQHIKQTKEQ